MKDKELLQLRLQQQQVSASSFHKPEDLVGWMGAVQAQDYAMAKWALGLRLPGVTDAMIENAFAKGEILRTHILRPTWHFVTPTDIRWMLKLTAPRIHTYIGHYYRKLELDQTVFKRSNKILEKILRAGRQLSRPEIAEAFKQAKINGDELRLNHLLIYAELEGLICSGARSGKQITYSLLEERVPPAPALSHEESLEKLAGLYFQSHGPATVKDFSWWSGLSTADARAGVELIKDSMESITSGEEVYWFKAGALPVKQKDEVYFLPNFDEYLVAYTNRDRMMSAAEKPNLSREGNPIFNNTVIVKGTVAGTWKRTIKASSVDISTELFTKPSAALQRKLDKAAGKYRQFLGK